jgi:metal-responsive CopG/Arc/MetJ family transcriptional regulator
MIHYHTMRKAKVALTLDAKVLERVDALVARRLFANRSQAVEAALREKLERLDKSRLARETARLVVSDEQSLAEEGIAGDAGSWPAW